MTPFHISAGSTQILSLGRENFIFLTTVRHDHVHLVSRLPPVTWRYRSRCLVGLFAEFSTWLTTHRTKRTFLTVAPEVSNMVCMTVRHVCLMRHFNKVGMYLVRFLGISSPRHNGACNNRLKPELFLLAFISRACIQAHCNIWHLWWTQIPFRNWNYIGRAILVYASHLREKGKQG